MARRIHASCRGDAIRLTGRPERGERQVGLVPGPPDLLLGHPAPHDVLEQPVHLDLPGEPVQLQQRELVDPLDERAAHVARRPRLVGQRVRRVEEQPGQRRRRAQVGQMAAHQASRAQRKPLKICRRIG